MKTGAERLQGFYCSVTSRRNSNGHTVYDVVEPGGLSRTVVLWEDETTEVIINGKTYRGNWNRDNDGDIRVTLNDGEFAFALPK